MLQNIKGHSIIASNILATSVETSTTSGTCGCCNNEEVKLDIIALPLAESISLSLNRFLSSESVTGDNRLYSPHVTDLLTVQERPNSWGHVNSSASALWWFQGGNNKNNTRANCGSETLMNKCVYLKAST